MRFKQISLSLQIFCHKGKPKYLVNVFNTVTLHLDIKGEDFTEYEGPDPEAVQSAYDDQRSIFSFNFLVSKRKAIKLNPFNQSCIGIDASVPYSVQLNLIRIDFWKVLCFALGLFIFFSSPGLSENPFFYYISGILLGVSLSFFILIWMASKLIPRKPMMYGALIGGWGLSVYFAQLMFDNIRVILITHQMYIFWYVLISALVSFVICYRIGPPQDQRTKNLIKWGLQLGALLLIFYSSDFQEASVGVNVLIFLLYHFPRRFINKGKLYWRRRFPPKRRLLTNEEFYEQGVRETSRALEDLRQFCSSPDSKPWRTMLKLKDASRFASFVEGDSHIRDEEILEYDNSRDVIEFSEDDDDDDDNENYEDEGMVPRYRNQRITNGQNGIHEDDDDEEDLAEISEDDDEGLGLGSAPSPGWVYDRFARNVSQRTNGTLRSTPTQRLTPQPRLTPQRITPPRAIPQPRLTPRSGSSASLRRRK